jgi:hypothetical protein
VRQGDDLTKRRGRVVPGPVTNLGDIRTVEAAMSVFDDIEDEFESLEQLHPGMNATH